MQFGFVRGCRALCVTFLLALIAPQTGLASGKMLVMPQPLSDSEILATYANKTWIWKKGGAFFSGDGSMSGWSTESGHILIAKGRWEVRRHGRMCMVAHWTSLKEDYAVTTCFDHRRLVRAIQQRKAPKGEWYLFDGVDPNAAYPASDLVRGNVIAGTLKRMVRDMQAGK